MNLKIEEETALEKDLNSNAVLNVNTANYLDFMSVYYTKIQESKVKEEQINSRIDKIETDVSEVKDLLKQLLEKLN